MRQTVKTHIARLLVVVFVGILLSAYIPASVSAAESGSCGASLNWQFAAGTLTISGEGIMPDYYDGNLPPWHHLAGEIKKLVLPEGLTVIGRQAFYNCTELTAVSVPASVRTIRTKAFYNCEKLRYIVLPDKLSTIGDAAFFGCRELVAVTLPETVEEIGAKAFYLCESLVSLSIPQSAVKLGYEAFAYCTSLLQVKIQAPIKTIPAWMFFGCSQLVEIEMPDTVTEIDEFAFQKCDGLVGVYHNGGQETANTIRQEIAEDLPNFKTAGFVGNGTISGTAFSTQFEIDENDVILSQTDTKIKVNDDLTVTTEVTILPGADGKDGTYHTVVSLVVTKDTGWEDAKTEVDATLRKVSDDYSPVGKETSAKVTIYVTDASAVNQDFVKSLTGRKVETEIVIAEGSSWSLYCENLKPEDISGNMDYSYRVEEMEEEVLNKLGSNDGYRVSFNTSAQGKSQIQVQLPTDTAGKNAFLYQVENDGSYTRLQAVEVDSKGTAHFYLASVDKDTDYLIGMNVPGEKTDDVIASPDRATQNAIVRLEQIQYVETGARTLHGMTLTGMLLTVMGILVVTGVVVGIIMTMYNKAKMNRYRPPEN